MNSENQALLNAQDAVKNSGLKTNHYEIFNATWFFEDKKDLYQSIFDYYNVPFDSRTAAEIINVAESKIEDEPIELSDELVIQLQKKT